MYLILIIKKASELPDHLEPLPNPIESELDSDVPIFIISPITRLFLHETDWMCIDEDIFNGVYRKFGDSFSDLHFKIMDTKKILKDAELAKYLDIRLCI